MRLSLGLLVLVALMSTAFIIPGCANTQYNESIIQHSESINGILSSNNTSSIQVREHSVVAQGPKLMVIGKGYYAENPINYNSQAGQQTWIKNKAAGVSINHEVGEAHSLNQTLEMASGGSSHQNAFGMTGKSGIQMKVTEDVQEGRVSIGVLRGGTTTGNGMTPSATALRNPSLDIEEDYIGNFHIEKNMTIQVPTRRLLLNYSWLPCFSGGCFDVPDYNDRYIGAKSVFDYRK
jgi:hypothetical protein